MSKLSTASEFLRRKIAGTQLQHMYGVRELRDEPSEDYPLGGSVEPYDIETEKDLCMVVGIAVALIWTGFQAAL